ncbi:hypothetical protein SBI67_08985 [Mycolicibacterium sp. 120266]|uniref:hypothetical protein n=1 Tax=Mycolicibacterium sp. 120266 TaxID=3090601 RepID=UPI00299F1E76|nr:hypothetical protein [Mycolicibacterium sp. 120266]MDX1872254.1 hypothetical protein [Mycolicibacterium sp. 120266]
MDAGIDPALPFLGTEARSAGLVTKRTLRSRHRLVYRNVYLPSDVELTPVRRAVAAWLWSDRRAVVSGMSAAALLGSKWIDHDAPAELARRAAAAVDGIIVHREVLRRDEVMRVRGIPVTTPARTAFDLGRRLDRVPAVTALDALAQASGVRARDVAALVDRHRGMRGILGLRAALSLMDGGAESPQETKTRLVLLDAGLRRPRTQIVVRNAYGAFVARLDMGWDEFKVGVEYDGAQHWTDPAQRTRDIDRSAELAALKWTIVRVSAELLRRRPHVLVARIGSALSNAGCPWINEPPECRPGAR